MAFPLDLPLWPRRPNWRDKLRSTFEFKTDIITSRANDEQRAALRYVPRRTLEFSALGLNSFTRTIERFLAQYQNTEVCLADYSRSVEVQINAPAGASVVRLTAAPYWVDEGAALIFQNGDAMEIAGVDLVSGRLVTLSSPLASAWAAGAVVSPAVRGRMSPNVRLTDRTSDVANFPLTFELSPDTEPVRSYPWMGTTLADREVVSFDPNWKTDITRQLIRPYNLIDYGVGVVSAITPVDFSQEVRQMDFLLYAEQIEQFIGWFYRARGRRGEFYFPTGQNDIVLATGSNTGNNFLLAPGTDIFDAYADDPTKGALQIVYRSGTTFNTKIASIVSLGGNSKINLVTALPEPVSRALVKRIAWLQCCRFGGDKLTLDYETSNKVVAQVALMTLKDLAVET